MTRRRTAGVIESATSAEASIKQKLDAVLATPEGDWMQARVLASTRFWPLAPAIKALILCMKPDNTPGLPTMAVDQYYRCYTTPAFVQKLIDEALAVSPENPCKMCGATKHHRLEYLAGVIVHESQHPIRKHGHRAKALNADVNFKLWNIAADLEINDDLLEGFRIERQNLNAFDGRGAVPCLPDYAMVPAVFRQEPYAEFSVAFPDDYPAEHYYYSLLDLRDKIQEERDKVADKLQKMKQQQKSDGSQDPDDDGKDNEASKGKGDEGEGKDQQDQQDSNGSGGESEEDLQKRLDHLDDLLGEAEQSDCGSGAHGHSHGYENGSPTPDNPGISEAENGAIQREIAREIRKQSVTRGNVPSGLVSWADEILTPPKVDWRQVITQLTQIATQRSYGHDQRSWSRLGRSSVSTGYKFLYPSTYRPIPRIGIVMDTSGSMGCGQGSPLYEATCEIEGICQQLNAQLVFVSVDAAAGEVVEIASIQDVPLQGGGGTDMRVGVAALEEYRDKPNVCIIVTDGYTPWPSEPVRGMDIIAAIVGAGVNDQSMLGHIPDFIDVVLVDDIQGS